MEREVLVTAGNGMFGHALITALLGDERVKVRAMVRDRGKFKLKAPSRCRQPSNCRLTYRGWMSH